ncbi:MULTISPECIES: Cro/CI family transcriptional regulator [Acinetobacter]|uniref:transcriptional regulator n=1 Tax=Acinetobacter TaxID=469 RepID=UPI00101F1DC1|nr:MULTISPECIES: Cro/CI family transcriptional regulator [Acinetobacter]MDM1757170.1 helix-turn-helix domain-containing protein [Acinetobacter sp. 256-1]MDM1760048.1 helix-turn-helix domain-containing protein [Acinetobacter sp. 251-1]RYL27189.1 Cro/Cl family transcriptional regulator [Acinetobacter piscicola]
MSSPHEAFDKAVKFAGSSAALARGIGLTPWAVSKWNIEKIPEDRCEAIEEFTQGKVKAEELRPDINWEYVRQIKMKMA